MSETSQLKQILIPSTNDTIPGPRTSIGPAIRNGSTAKWDWRIAWVVTVVPVIATVAAVVLNFVGLRAGRMEFITLVIFYILTGIGIEVGYHRQFSHCSFRTYTFVRALLAILGSMAFEGPVIWWAATHRRHHTYSDHDGDPHSPNLHGSGKVNSLIGLYHSHMGWLFDPTSTRGAGWNRYAPDLYKDRLVLWVHMTYFYWLLLGLALPAVVEGLIYGSLKGALLGLLWGGFVRMCLLNQAIWSVNSIAHRFGRRDYSTEDLSRNVWWLSLPTMGQAWHNNHHAFPSSAVADLRVWQLDPSAWVIRGLKLCRLAWSVKTPTPEQLARKAIGGFNDLRKG